MILYITKTFFEIRIIESFRKKEKKFRNKYFSSSFEKFHHHFKNVIVTTTSSYKRSYEKHYWAHGLNLNTFIKPVLDKLF